MSRASHACSNCAALAAGLWGPAWGCVALDLTLGRALVAVCMGVCCSGSDSGQSPHCSMHGRFSPTTSATSGTARISLLSFSLCLYRIQPNLPGRPSITPPLPLTLLLLLNPGGHPAGGPAVDEEGQPGNCARDSQSHVVLLWHLGRPAGEPWRVVVMT